MQARYLFHNIKQEEDKRNRQVKRIKKDEEPWEVEQIRIEIRRNKN